MPYFARGTLQSCIHLTRRSFITLVLRLQERVFWKLVWMCQMPVALRCRYFILQVVCLTHQLVSVQVVSPNPVLCIPSALGRLTSSGNTDLVWFRLQLPLHRQSQKFPRSRGLQEPHQPLMPSLINASLLFTEMLLVITAGKLSLASDASVWIVLVSSR